MLTALSIRDIVLIERLDLTLGSGLTAFTGETGAGKSILLDSLGLALGARGDAALVREGAEKGVVTAAFDLAPGHAVFALLNEHDVEADGELVIRRVQSRDGRSRATLNDQPVSVNLLRRVGSLIAEIHGQHDDRALVDVANHRRLLDAYAGLEREGAEVAQAWEAWRAAEDERRAHAERLERAEAERAFLEHAVAELDELAPEEDEEDALADRRQMMMNAEQFASALNEAADALAGDGAGGAKLNAALRRLERRREEAGGRLDAVISALDRLLVEMGEADSAIAEAQRSFEFDPSELDRIEERLFALRAAARKHKVQVGELPALLERFRADLDGIEEGGNRLRHLDAAVAAARAHYLDCAHGLSASRQAAAAQLGEAVMAELGPLKLEHARFEAAVETDEGHAGPHGMDRVEFRVATNPGSAPGPLIKIASGGELARFMLALKVVLAARASAPTLIFDEIDTGVGGAVADAIGARLASLADALQVLAVTHSPQVAARAHAHMLVAKNAHGDGGVARMVTRVDVLGDSHRREEIARMLSGASITEEARAQAQRLLAGTG
ncbi:DNA repair protein RecN [Kaustia mangrovi]|uniref:DNA repair protein RecN n=1 Tax=Kaustia mangrovi TaxID=2593653 RepID=A0A7S8C7U4_9HYPH|nr:DNA repair protein RecN [Kaustia mangrovi]QPC44891.1 DNA repair protein RecN [Kaustia mangrovi]